MNYNRNSTHLIFFKSFSIYIKYKSEIKYDWKNSISCAIIVFVTKKEKYKKGNAKTSSNDNFLFYAFGD